MSVTPQERRIGLGSTLSFTYLDVEYALAVVGGWESSETTEEVDITLMDERSKYFCAGDNDPGSLNVDVAFITSGGGLATLAALEALKQTGDTVVWTETIPAKGASPAATSTFQGFLNAFGKKVQKVEFMTVQVGIKRSGPTYLFDDILGS